MELSVVTISVSFVSWNFFIDSLCTVH